MFMLIALVLSGSFCFGEVWINEFHYDNDGGDADEGVEVAGTAGTDLSSYELIGYNGNDGSEYNRVSLTGLINDEGSGYGAVWFDFTGLQNGDPDGIALVWNGTSVIQFLSYEGSFTAADGPAMGMDSVDIEASEPPVAVGQSLQLVGTGATYNNFIWATNIASHGSINAGQSFGTPSLNANFSVDASSGPAPLTVQFTDLTSGGQAPYQHTYTFGDGSTSTSVSPQHVYATSGVYTVSLYVRDQLSAEDTEIKTDYITVSFGVPVALPADPVTASGFTANWSNVPGAVSYRLDVSDHQQFGTPAGITSFMSNDFENGSISLWEQSTPGRWAASTDSPINGSYSLHHIYNSTNASTDTVSRPLTGLNLGQTVIWRFQVRHGYAPSGNNNWTFYLMADQPAAQMGRGGSAKGYAVGVNFYESDDTVKLYEINAGFATVLIDSGLNWEGLVGTSRAAGFEVMRNANGEWTLRIDADGGFDNLATQGTATDTNHTTTAHMGLYYKYSLAQDMKLWLDDLSIDQAGGLILSMLPGYSNLLVNSTSQMVTGLIENSLYYYRVRAYSGSLYSGNSNTQAVRTLRRQPRMHVLGVNGVEIPNGDVAPDLARGTQFGAYDLDSGLSTRTLAITNFGDDMLSISGIHIAGEHAADFSVESVPSHVAPMTASNLVIGFDPRLTGERMATISLFNNDPTIYTFDFMVAGTGAVFSVPVAYAADAIASNSFRANWQDVGYAAGYLLDVARDSSFRGSEGGGAGQGVILSELAPISSSYDRYIEVYNLSESPVSLDGWSVKAIGGGYSNTQWTLSGQLGAGESVICGHPDNTNADFTTTWFITPLSAWDGLPQFGPEGAMLYNASTQCVDCLLVVTNSFQNKSLNRNPDVTQASQDSDFGEWSALPGSQASPKTHNSDYPNEFVGGYMGRAVGDVTSMVVTGLTPAMVYYYRVRATNAIFVSKHSNTQMVQTLGQGAAEDSDGDGMPNWWESRYFGNETNMQASLNSDGDGYSNLDEYTLGTSPVFSNSVPVDVITNAQLSVGQTLIMTFGPPSTNTSLYDVWWTTNLLNANWIPYGLNVPGKFDGSAVQLTVTNVGTYRIYRTGAKLP